MAQKKVTEMTENTSPTVDDLVYSVDDPAGAKNVRKVTLGNVLKAINGLTAETAPAIGDKLALYDIGSSAADAITLENLFKVVSSLTQLAAAPDVTNDDLLIIDGGTTPKYINLTNLLASIASLTDLTTGYHATQDRLFISDNGVAKSTTLPNLFAGIEDALAQKSTPPNVADTFLAIEGGVAKYITFQKFMDGIAALPQETVLAAADVLPVYDISGTHAAYMTYPNFMATIEDALTALTTQPAQTDTLLVIDGGVAKFIQKRNFQMRYVQMVVTEFTTAVATGNGQFYMHIPPDLSGLNLSYVHGENITAGTTGTMSIMIRNTTDSQDMLSTALTIDSGETGSDTAATPVVINTSYDDVVTNDVIQVDIDAIHTTAAEGLIITLGFN